VAHSCGLCSLEYGKHEFAVAPCPGCDRLLVASLLPEPIPDIKASAYAALISRARDLYGDGFRLVPRLADGGEFPGHWHVHAEVQRS